MGRMFFMSKEDQVGVSANTIPPWLGGMVLADIQRPLPPHQLKSILCNLFNSNT